MKTGNRTLKMSFLLNLHLFIEENQQKSFFKTLKFDVNVHNKILSAYLYIAHIFTKKILLFIHT